MKKLPVFFAVISFTIFFIFSCKKEKNDVATVDYGSSNNSLRTTVTGIVLDENNAPLTGVSVTAYGQTTSTNQFGTFVLKNLEVNKDRCVLQFVKTGFFNRAHGFIAAGNTVNYVRIILLSNAATQNFSSSAGGTISLPDGSSAAFQPNSFVTSNGSAYTGTVNLTVKHLSPDDVNFGFTIPGGDLAGVNANNEDVILYTYGMLGVELTGSSGETLQLATGTSAILTLSIAASQLATAPATIPLWFFDETTSLWKEEGAANKVGNNYVGTVSHFTWWNCDTPAILSRITGKVVDCNGIGMPNVAISLNGISGAFTNQNGEYSELFISGATSLMELQVLAAYNNGILSSQVEIIPTLSANQVFVVPDLVVSCPTRVAGTIKTCSGETTDGVIFLTNSGFSIYQYTTNGNFNLISIPNSQLDLNVFNLNTSYYQTITSLSAPSVLNVGNLFLCDTIGSGSNGNNFTLTGSPFPNQIFDITTSSVYAHVTDTFGFAQTSILITGSALPNYTISHFSINVWDTVPSATICDIYIVLNDLTDNYQINSDNITCNLTQVGMIGGQIKGTYYGSAVTSSNGGTITGYISGSFDVIRTQ